MAENAGVSINMFNDILMDDRFLMYAVGEFERFDKCELQCSVH